MKLAPTRQGVAECLGVARTLSPLAIASHPEESGGEHLHLPSPGSVLRHACPVVAESVLIPLALFYFVLVITGFRGAVVAALAWSYLAMARRLRRKERVSTMLLLGTLLLTVRTAVAFVTGSAFLYFIQPTVMTAAVCLVLVGSAIVGRPFTQRFAADFCPIGPELLARPRVRRFFIRISLLWATVLMANAGIVLWLLVSSSLRAFVVEREAVTLSLTALAIFFSITRFMAAVRRDGVSVQWHGHPASPVLGSEVG
jgi:intracellular septation protein A